MSSFDIRPSKPKPWICWVEPLKVKSSDSGRCSLVGIAVVVCWMPYDDLYISSWNVTIAPSSVKV